MPTREQIINKIVNITAALERLESANIVVDTWIHEHEGEDPALAWFPEYAQSTINTTRVKYETERERLDMLLAAINTPNATPNAAPPTRYPELTDRTVLMLSDIIDGLTHIETIQFTNEFFETAVKTGDAPAVSLLLHRRIEPYRLALSDSTKLNHVGVVRFLLDDRRVDPFLEYPLIIASDRGFLEIVREILADGRVHPSAYVNSAIVGASRNGHAEIVRELLADPRMTGFGDLRDRGRGDLLNIACDNGHVDVVRILLADNRFRPSPVYLQTACKNGHVDIIRALLADARSTINADVINAACTYTIGYREDPVRTAATHAEIVRMLLADPRADPLDKIERTIKTAIKSYIQTTSPDVFLELLKDPRVAAADLPMKDAPRELRDYVKDIQRRRGGTRGRGCRGRQTRGRQTRGRQTRGRQTRGRQTRGRQIRGRQTRGRQTRRT